MSTAKTMAAVLAEHQRWVSSCGPEQECECGVRLVENSDAGMAAHQAEVLSAAGFGLVADTKAEALREAAEHFKQRSDTYFNTMQEMTASKEYGLEDIVRYGAYSAEANTTATWLRTKAAVIRNES